MLELVGFSKEALPLVLIASRLVPAPAVSAVLAAAGSGFQEFHSHEIFLLLQSLPPASWPQSPVRDPFAWLLNATSAVRLGWRKLDEGRGWLVAPVV